MPFELIEPFRGIMREFSPEVPPEVRARLILGDLPDPLRKHSHPVTLLLRDRWKQLGGDRKQAAREIAGCTGYAKTIRRIDELLSGERLLPDWIDRLSDFLKITDTDLAAAWQETERWEQKRFEFCRIRSRHRVYDRFGPYLSPLAFPGFQADRSSTRDFKKRVSSMFEVHCDPEPTDLIPWLHERSELLIECMAPIAGWLYVRSPEETYFFSTAGEILTTGAPNSPAPDGMHEHVGQATDE